MTKMGKRRLALAIGAGLPILAWLAVAKKAGYIEPGHVFLGVYHAVLGTTSSPALIGTLVLGLIAAIGIIWLLAKTSSSQFAGAEYDRFLRGTKMETQAGLAKITNDKVHSQVGIANVPIPISIERMHFLINGATGGGKSVAMRELAYDALKRGDKLAVIDPDGSMMSRFYRKGDKILNPFDARTQGWSIFNEIRRPYDFERYAISLVPVSDSHESEEWAEYGRLLLRSVMMQLAAKGDPSMREVIQWCNIKPLDDLRELVKGTDAEALYAGTSKSVGSARFVLSKALPPHTYMPAGEFSIRDWIDDPHSGNLWIAWREDMATALKPSISAWTDTLAPASCHRRKTRIDPSGF